MSGEQTTAGDRTAYRIAVSSDDGGPAVTQEPGQAFEHLWTPYRMAYIRGEGKPTGEHDCPFCVIPTMSDEDGLIVARGTTVFAVLNLYPYNAGHLMVVPYRHVPDYTDLTIEEVAELGAFTQTAMRTVRVGERGARVQHRHEPGARSPAPASPTTCTSTRCRAGVGTPTSCRSSGSPGCCPRCWRDTRALLAAAWAGVAVPVREA